jgi:signal transduction histidine kinase/phage shock protein PspC (stress-responsive transcriptional regulator)
MMARRTRRRLRAGSLLAAAPGQRRLVRETDGRLLGGVAGGFAAHLGLPVVAVRAAFVVLSGFGGAGVLAYALLWALTPDADDGAVGRRARADPAQIVGFAALGLAVLLLDDQFGLGARGVVWPLVIGGLGVALVWQQADAWRVGRGAPFQLLRGARGALLARLLAGALLLAAGLAGFLATQGQLRNARNGLLSTVVVVAGVALLSGPWWLRIWRELTAERRERIRVQEHAEIAAHVHDSVLHTLALIQRNADDPRAVARLARGQERELRTWLYRPDGRQPDADTLSSALEAVIAEVEENHGVVIETVVVGDAPLDERCRAVVLAAREALVNAAKSSGVQSVSVYAEAEPGSVTVFVRDRGRGFDPAAIPADRHGISGSILGRMERSGGTASVRSAPGEGTEIELSMRLSS